MLWFFIDANLFYNPVSWQIENLLYGLQELEGPTITGNYLRGKCFYFGYSEFYRNKQLDAVIIQSQGSLTLNMNDFSAQCDELRQTKLYRLFVEGNLRIIEPSKMEKDKLCLIADDFFLSRKDSQAVADYIRTKYGFREIKAYNHPLLNFSLD